MRGFGLVASSVVALTLTLGGYGTALAGQSLVAQINTDKVYSLQIIAHDRCPKGTFDNSNRRSIAVLADFTPDVNTGDVFVTIEDKRNLIFLVPGDTFQVLDGNACNQGGAVFQLPPDVSTSFEVWVRLVGKPGSGLDVTTCAVIARPQLGRHLGGWGCRLLDEQHDENPADRQGRAEVHQRDQHIAQAGQRRYWLQPL